MQEFQIKINIPGGFISAGDFLEILEILEDKNVKNIQLGNRQNIYFKIPIDYLEPIKFDFIHSNIPFEIDSDQYPNIMSSYIAQNIFTSDNWLKEGVYKYIFELIDFQPRFKINLIDSSQTFIPYFTGNVNFINSLQENYWYCLIRYPKSNKLFTWPGLVYTDDIPQFYKIIEKVFLENLESFHFREDISSDLFLKKVMEILDIEILPNKTSLPIPDFNLPNYEGLHPYGNQTYWLGIYRRVDVFEISFLKELCFQSIKSRIGQLYFSPWRTLLIKGIQKDSKKDWLNLLDRFLIPCHHSQNELNWQLEDLSSEGMNLKNRLIRFLEERDIRTEGLVFAIKLQPRSGIFGSIIIKREGKDPKPKPIDFSYTYTLLYTLDFNPNTKEYQVWENSILESSLPNSLLNLIYTYYVQKTEKFKKEENRPGIHPESGFDSEPLAELLEGDIWQCSLCYTQYSNQIGDSEKGIPAGIDFTELKEYTCPLCEADKTLFLKISA